MTSIYRDMTSLSQNEKVEIMKELQLLSHVVVSHKPKKTTRIITTVDRGMIRKPQDCEEVVSELIRDNEVDFSLFGKEFITIHHTTGFVKLDYIKKYD